MFKKLRKLLGMKVREKRVSERLFANILLPSEPKDYFRWPYVK